jgi:hypothetical protein
MAKSQNPHDAARRRQHPITVVKPPAVKKVAVPPRKKR